MSQCAISRNQVGKDAQNQAENDANGQVRKDAQKRSRKCKGAFFRTLLAFTFPTSPFVCGSWRV